MINKLLYYAVLLLSANICSMEHGLNHNLGIGNDMQTTTTTFSDTPSTAKDKTTLNQHMVKHSNDKSYKCTVEDCDYATKIIGNFKRHMVKHSDDRSYKCTVEGCDYAAKTKNNLKVHMIKHSDDKPYKCTVEDCDYAVKTKRYLKRHMIKHSDDRPYKCTVEGCDYVAKTKKNLKGHINVLNYDNVNLNTTESSIYALDSSSHNVLLNGSNAEIVDNVPNLPESFEENKQLDNRSFKCEIENCGYVAKFKSVLIQHMKKHSNDRPYKCKVEGCGYSAKIKGNLNKHMARHSNDKPYKCTVVGCGYSAKIKENLNKHMARHSNDRPYKCEIGNCSSVFKISSDLRRHMLRHIGASVYECNFENCNYITYDKYILLKHITSDHSASNNDGIQYSPLNIDSSGPNDMQVMFETSSSVNEEFPTPVLNSEQNIYWPNYDNYNDDSQVSLDTSQTLGSPSTSTYNPISQMPFDVGNLNVLNNDNTNLNITTSSENYNYSTSDQSTLVRRITLDHNTYNDDGIQYSPLNMYSSGSNDMQVMFPTSNSVNEEFSTPVLNSEQNNYWSNHDNYNDNLQVSLDTSQTLGSFSTEIWDSRLNDLLNIDSLYDSSVQPLSEHSLSTMDVCVNPITTELLPTQTSDNINNCADKVDSFSCQEQNANAIDLSIFDDHEQQSSLEFNHQGDVLRDITQLQESNSTLSRSSNKRRLHECKKCKFKAKYLRDLVFHIALKHNRIRRKSIKNIINVNTKI